MNDLEHNEQELGAEEEEVDDADASIDESMLDEIGGDTAEDDDEKGGFGHIDEDDAEEAEDDPEDGNDDDESLEEDAEDVDFDTFDDVDEL